MTRTHINGIGMHYEMRGHGPPLVLVHGSWTNGDSWAGITPTLAESFRVITYDRRGHSRSDRPEGFQPRRADDEDLVEIIETLAGGPAHVVANSFGGLIALGAAASRPDLFRSIYLHEPPAMSLIGDAAAPFFTGAKPVVELIEAGNSEAGARAFVEMVLGVGAWLQTFSEAGRATFAHNAPTFAEEIADTTALDVPTDALIGQGHRVLLSAGTTSPPFFPAIADRLAATIPNAERVVIDGAGHAPHLSHPAEYVTLINEFATRTERVAA